MFMCLHQAFVTNLFRLKHQNKWLLLFNYMEIHIKSAHNNLLDRSHLPNHLYRVDRQITCSLITHMG